MKVAVCLYIVLICNALCSSQGDNQSELTSLQVIYNIFVMLLMILFAYAGKIFHQKYLKVGTCSSNRSLNSDSRKIDAQILENLSHDDIWGMPSD